ncbi:MAG: DUF3450 domain-containing protein [Amphritea sp.]|nr:DUF3450 domain-containing protein [Amphritea sp.]
MKLSKLPLPMVLSLLCLMPGISQSSELIVGQQKTISTHKQSQKSQQRIDQMERKSDQARSEYLDNERMADVTEAYNRQISRLIASQEQELADLKKQLASIEETDRAVLPMLNKMVDTLRRFVAADLPFLPDERQQRLQRLQGLLSRADVSVAEKYRQILEAYMVEVQYGRTFEAYSGSLIHQADNLQVNYLRVGRAALYYQALGGEQSALWLPAEQRWKTLTEEQNLTLSQAIRIARQQLVPALVDLPLPALESES